MEKIGHIFKTLLQIVGVIVAIVALISIGLSIMVGVLIEQLDGTCSVIHEFTCSNQHLMTISKCWFDGGYYSVYTAYRNGEKIGESAHVMLESDPE